MNRTATTTRYALSPSPIGALLVMGDDEGRVTGLYVDGEAGAPAVESAWRDDPASLRKALDQLDAYFDGQLLEFELDLSLVGTAFQRDVWSELERIPFGQTSSYGQIADEVGRSGASRAVGQANGRNPISIIVPCHRVIAADGGLGGYGWGLERKRWLLDHEARVAGKGLPAS